MSQFYSSLATVANRLLASKGQAVTLTRTSEKTYDPSLGATNGVPTIETGRGVRLNYGDDKDTAAAANGSNVPVGRVKLLLGTSGISKAPGMGDSITLLDETGVAQTWAVLSCDTLAPAGTAVAYVCKLGV